MHHRLASGTGPPILHHRLTVIVTADAVRQVTQTDRTRDP